MAENDPKKEFLSLMGSFAPRKSQGERMIKGLKRSIDGLQSKLDSANAELEKAKNLKETSERYLRRYEVKLSTSEASIQALEARVSQIQKEISVFGSNLEALKARVSQIQKEISVLGSNLEALKSEERAWRDEFINKMYKLNADIRKFQGETDPAFSKITETSSAEKECQEAPFVNKLPVLLLEERIRTLKLMKVEEPLTKPLAKKAMLETIQDLGFVDIPYREWDEHDCQIIQNLKDQLELIAFQYGNGEIRGLPEYFMEFIIGPEAYGLKLRESVHSILSQMKYIFSKLIKSLRMGSKFLQLSSALGVIIEKQRLIDRETLSKEWAEETMMTLLANIPTPRAFPDYTRNELLLLSCVETELIRNIKEYGNGICAVPPPSYWEHQTPPFRLQFRFNLQKAVILVLNDIQGKLNEVVNRGTCSRPPVWRYSVARYKPNEDAAMKKFMSLLSKFPNQHLDIERKISTSKEKTEKILKRQEGALRDEFIKGMLQFNATIRKYEELPAQPFSKGECIGTSAKAGRLDFAECQEAEIIHNGLEKRIRLVESVRSVSKKWAIKAMLDTLAELQVMHVPKREWAEQDHKIIDTLKFEVELMSQQFENGKIYGVPKAVLYSDDFSVTKYFLEAIKRIHGFLCALISAKPVFKVVSSQEGEVKSKKQKKEIGVECLKDIRGEAEYIQFDEIPVIGALERVVVDVEDGTFFVTEKKIMLFIDIALQQLKNTCVNHPDWTKMNSTPLELMKKEMKRLSRSFGNRRVNRYPAAVEEQIIGAELFEQNLKIAVVEKLKEVYEKITPVMRRGVISRPWFEN